MRRKQETNVTCPACGTELAFADKKVTIAESPATSIVSAQLPKTAHERIEAPVSYTHLRAHETSV